MVGTPPLPQALAHALFSHASGGDTSPAAVVAAAEHAHARLRAGLSVFFGQAGFDSLWGRAMSLAPHSVAGAAGADAAAPLLPASGWSAVVEGRTVDETRAGVLAVFTSFIALLFTFVGPDVGSRLLHQVWPELPLDVPGTSTGDVPR